MNLKVLSQEVLLKPIKELKPIIEPQKSVEEIIESTYKEFLNLRIESTTYKILLFVFWQGKAFSPKKISKSLNLTPSTVRDAVRQLHKMGLLFCPKRGVYRANRDNCLAMVLHVYKILNEKLPRQ